MRRRLLLATVLFAAAVPPAGSAPPTISILSHTTVAEGWETFQVYGAVTGARAGEAIDVEAYPKTGFPNPVVDLFVYDIASKKTTRVDTRDRG